MSTENRGAGRVEVQRYADDVGAMQVACSDAGFHGVAGENPAGALAHALRHGGEDPIAARLGRTIALEGRTPSQVAANVAAQMAAAREGAMSASQYLDYMESGVDLASAVADAGGTSAFAERAGEPDDNGVWCVDPFGLGLLVEQRLAETRDES